MLSNYLTLLTSLSALAAASPIAFLDTPQYFAVDKFSYGYTSPTGYFSFDVTVHGAAENHPEILTPVQCAGSAPASTYFTCSHISTTQSISAYIDSDDILRLSYGVNAMDGNYYTYFGHKKVYSATGPNADQQNSDFYVDETAGTV